MPLGEVGREERGKTGKEIFPCEDDGGDGKGKTHAPQTEGRAAPPIILELEEHCIRE